MSFAILTSWAGTKKLQRCWSSFIIIFNLGIELSFSRQKVLDVLNAIMAKQIARVFAVTEIIIAMISAMEIGSEAERK
ncbi:MAG: hypothetical protein LUG96_06600 [Tannerellaceae bacterium]|nr:hypothetical protein [Tannerellaceae bacterium]